MASGGEIYSPKLTGLAEKNREMPGTLKFNRGIARVYYNFI